MLEKKKKNPKGVRKQNVCYEVYYPRKQNVARVIKLFKKHPEKFFTTKEMSQHIDRPQAKKRGKISYFSGLIREYVKKDIFEIHENGNGKPCYGLRLDNIANVDKFLSEHGLDELSDDVSSQKNEQVEISESDDTSQSDPSQEDSKKDESQVKETPKTPAPKTVASLKDFQTLVRKMTSENTKFMHCSVCFKVGQMDSLFKCSHDSSCHRYCHPECINTLETQGVCKDCKSSNVKKSSSEFCCDAHKCQGPDCDSPILTSCSFCCKSYCRAHKEIQSRRKLKLCPECSQLFKQFE